MSKINKIAILTSGGDSAGMNSAVKAIVHTAINKGLTPYLVYEGFKGLVENKIEKATMHDTLGIEFIGGTVIYSARYPQFKEVDVRKIAVSNLKKHKIDALVVIGGDGSYMGASKLSEMGIKTIGLPGTIDNDIASTDYTIGFASALKNITSFIDSVRATAHSHERAMIVETMGRHCGDLALFAAIATGAEVLSTSERKLSEQEIIKQVAAKRKEGKRSIIVLVTEHLYDVHQLAKKIEIETKIETRANVIAHSQRGARPEPFDQVLASTMGSFAVEELIKGKTNVAVNIVNNKLVTKDILKVVKMKRVFKKDYYKHYDNIK